MSKQKSKRCCYIIYVLPTAVSIYYEEFLLTLNKSILNSEIHTLKRNHTSFYVIQVFKKSRKLYLRYDAPKIS